MADPSRTAASIEVLPATADRWADLVTLLGGGGERGCWCQSWRQTSTDYSRLGPGGGRRALRGQVDEPIAPGVIAYLDGVPVGWCGFGPRSTMARLGRSRTIPRVDDVDVWSVVCFVV